MRQVLAVAVAALLVAAAVLGRNALDGDDDDDGDDTDPPEELVIACVPELRDACEPLGARIEDPAATIAGGDVDAWVTFDPWPDIAALGSDPRTFSGATAPVARSELVLLTRAADLPDSCGGNPDWVCVTDGRAALPSPESALGTLLLGHAALGWNSVVRDGAPFAANDFNLAEFDDWRRSLQFTRDPVADMLQLGRAGPVATGTTSATFDTTVQDSRERENLDATPTDVRATVAVIVVGPAAEDVAEDEELLDGLAELGWTLDPAATTTGLPNPGVLFALQELA